MDSIIINMEDKQDKFNLNLNSRFTRDPVVSCRIEGEDGAILFNPDTNSSVLVNSSGVQIWNFLKEPHSIEEIIAFICNTYTKCPDKDTIKTEIINLITDLTPGFILKV